jgi:hypothetical protein
VFLALASGEVLAQPTSDPSFGKSRVQVPQATDDGSWGGTWFYASRDFRVALWLRPGENGPLPDYRFQLRRAGTEEHFATDWKGQATYDLSGSPGKFSMTLVDGDADELSGSWDWTVDFIDSARGEHSPIRVFRIGDGRNLAIHFEDFRIELTRGGETQVIDTEQIWTFRKASRRMLGWDELPF